MTIYRKIYEQHYGSIPVDEHGRTYEIHHIDGDNTNNDITNLKCVSIKEHFDIHASQGDWDACFAMSIRMKLSPEQLSLLSTKQNLQRVQNGTHPFLGGAIARQMNIDRVQNGTHPFSKKSDGSSIQTERVKNKTHHLLKDSPNNPTQVKWQCPHCNKEGKGTNNFVRWHGNACKSYELSSDKYINEIQRNF